MIFKKTIKELVEENNVYARALHHLGIDFFACPHQKLKKICEVKKIKRDQIIHTFYLFDTTDRCSFKELDSYPIKILIEYLKHAHHLFIKDRLPYILYLLKNQESKQELKTLLSEFVEDLIKHIYEEEDICFRYVVLLDEIKKNKNIDLLNKLMGFDKFSLKEEFEDHNAERDELSVVKSLISSSANSSCLLDKVLHSEILTFDREMFYHAEIENRIFFPKAIQLEKEILKSISG